MRPSTIHSPSGFVCFLFASGLTRTLTTILPLLSDLDVLSGPDVSGFGVEPSAGSSYVVAEVE